MPARIAHISDTHLGTRPRDGVRLNVWGEEMRSQLLENDFYERFREIFDRIAKLDPPVDLVIHSGDLYNSPWEGNPQQPPVVAQETAVSVLKDFMESTGIPVLIIEGNHGLYRLLEVSLLDLLKVSVPDLDVATQQDLKWAISKGEPLTFYYENLDVFCFPFIDEPVLRASNMVDVYDDWITTHQKPDRSRPSAAVAHGMKLDRTLNEAIFSMDYDYVALGHDHKQQKVTKKAWYAGSPERWRFDEISHDKGFLVVDIEAGKDPVVTPQIVEFERPVIRDTLKIDADETSATFEEKIKKWFESRNLNTAWNAPSAARVRLSFEGGSTQTSSLDLTLVLEAVRLEVLSSDSEYNVAQFYWNMQPSADKDYVAGDYPEIESDYLIEDPQSDFRDYLSTLELDSGLDENILTRIAVRSLEHAVGKRQGKLTTESLWEDEQ
jgi:DNA repair exonuclease SbcCD nuclease subunit